MAALYVLVYHINVLFLPGVILPFLSSGFQGVDLFFVLTGFLLTTLYGGSHFDARRYFTRRVFRTFPLYWLTLPLFMVLGMVAVTPLAVVYLQNFWPATFRITPPWTLCLEETFYFAVFPLLRLVLNRKRAVYGLLIASVVLSVAWRIVFLRDAVSTDFFWLQMPDYFVCYMFGVWAALYGFRDRALAVFMFIAASFMTDYNVIEPVFSGAAYALILCAFQDSRVFTNRVALWLGDISYGVYLWQLPLYALFGPLAAFLTLGVSTASYHLFEKPLTALGHRLTASKPA
jgi:peptidoglycan/LPS O-acetylase OafA/YrhL